MNSFVGSFCEFICEILLWILLRDAVSNSILTSFVNVHTYKAQEGKTKDAAQALKGCGDVVLDAQREEEAALATLTEAFICQFKEF